MITPTMKLITRKNKIKLICPVCKNDVYSGDYSFLVHESQAMEVDAKTICHKCGAFAKVRFIARGIVEEQEANNDN